MDIAYVDLILSEIMKTLVLPNEGGDPNSVARCITFVCQVTDHLFNHMQVIIHPQQVLGSMCYRFL